MKHKNLTFSAIALAISLSHHVTAHEMTPEVQAKVLNGESATSLASNLLPWQAAILTEPLFDNSIISGCGAVIISEHWVVTAAHCAEPAAPSGNTLVAGLNYIPQGTADQVDAKYKFTIEEKIWHESYQEITSISNNPGELDHDIAVMRVKESLFTVGKAIKIATKAEQELANSQFANTWNASGYSEGNLIASGWGRMQPSYQSPNDLQVVKLGGIPMSQCDSGYTMTSGSHFVCADSNNPAIKKDVCAGDSGGPLIWQNPDDSIKDAPDFGLRVVAVTSNGPTCSAKNAGISSAQGNGLYTELAAYRDWIETKTGLNLDSVPTSNFEQDPFKLVKEDEHVQRKSGGSGGSVPLTTLLSLGLVGFLRKKK